MTYSVYYLLETSDKASRIIVRCWPYDPHTLNWQTAASDNGPVLNNGYAEVVTNTTPAGFTSTVTPAKATRFGVTATPTTTVGATTTFIGAKPTDFSARTLVISIPPPSTVKAYAPQSGIFASLVPPDSDKIDFVNVHVHTIFQGDKNKKVTYKQKSYELRFIAVSKGGPVPDTTGPS